jgi:hypothetical protein
MANEFKVRKSLVVNGSGSVLLDVQGSQGQLFSVTDSLSGSLFAVKDISGMPVIEAFSDNTVRMGQFNRKALYVSQSRVGIGKETLLSATLDISGSTTVTGSFTVSGSSTFSGSVSSNIGFTGSLFGSATSASYALTASYTPGSGASVSASYAATSSFADNFTARTLSLGTNAINVTTGYGNYVSSISYPTTGSTDSADFWIRIVNTNAAPLRFRIFIEFSVDNTFSQDEFQIVTSGYGMTNHILRLPTSFYNTSKVIGVLTSNPGGATQEIWLNIAGITNSGNINIYSNLALDSLANMQASKTLTKPTKAGGGTELTLNNTKRQIYTLQTSAGAEFNGPVSVSGSLTVLTGTLTVASASLAVSGSLSINGVNITATGGFQQTFASATTWTVTHNLNTLYPVVTVYNSAGQVIIPTSITATSVNVTTVTFSTAAAGTINIISGQLQQNIAVSNPTAVALSTVLGG